MPPPSFDTSRRRSLDGTSKTTFSTNNGQNFPDPTHPSSFMSRVIPHPLSPPQNMQSSTSPLHHHGHTSRGPYMASSFSGIRDTASSHRPSGSMSISSMLGEEGSAIRSMARPRSPVNASPVQHNPHRSYSPVRARSASLRDPYEPPMTNALKAVASNEPRSASAFLDIGRDAAFPSPVYPKESIHSFRNFQPQQQEPRKSVNVASFGRPMSQPSDILQPRHEDEVSMSQENGDARFAAFRHFGGPQGQNSVRELGSISDTRRSDSMQPNHGRSDDLHNHRGPHRDGQANSFLSDDRLRAQPHSVDAYYTQSSSQLGQNDRDAHSRTDHARDGQNSPALTSHTKISETTTVEDQHRNALAAGRRGIEGSLQRSVFSISPELNRKGRNSPLPQAVHGVQPRHIGPGGDNPGIKTEFGRMFSGLGSGVGSTVPMTLQSSNGRSTPSRSSPSRPPNENTNVRVATNGSIEGASSHKAARTTGKHEGRRAREANEKENVEETYAESQRGGKRARASHHHHHHVHTHHHHHRETPEMQPGSFSMLRFPSTTSNPAPNGQQAHHHHHHAAQTPHHHHHHHHHHSSRPSVATRQSTVTITSKRLLEDQAGRPRGHLGSQLYSTIVSLPSTLDVAMEPRYRFNSDSEPIPNFEGRENCTFTIRVPRWYFRPTETHEDSFSSMSALEVICRRRQLWGTGVYTDDSDVVAAAVHAGWIRGDFGNLLEETEDDKDHVQSVEAGNVAMLRLSEAPKRPVKVPFNHDVHITVLILPPLQKYVSTFQHHIGSREWDKTHDGMSFAVHRIDFVKEGPTSRSIERTPGARKKRIALEERRRLEAANEIMAFARHGMAATTVVV